MKTIKKKDKYSFFGGSWLTKIKIWSGEIEKAGCCGFINRSEAADLKIQRLPLQKPLVNASLFQTQAGTFAPFPVTNRDRVGEKDIRIKNKTPSTRVSQTLCVANVLASINQVAERLCNVCCKTHQPVVSYCSLSSTMHLKMKDIYHVRTVFWNKCLRHPHAKRVKGL